MNIPTKTNITLQSERDKPFPDGDQVKLMGIRVISSASLPEGILMFVREATPEQPQAKVIGIIDNRKEA